MTRDEALKIVSDARRAGERPDLRNSNLDNRHLRYADLRYADLRNANMSGANMNSADLRNANMSGADLRYANMSNANLQRCDLLEANLTRADLRGADLRGANMSGANMSGADLTGAKFSPTTQWPSPTVLLLASWRKVSDELTILLMAFDASCHPNPDAFDRWAAGGACPYNDVKWLRAVNFCESRDLWTPDCKYMHPRPIDLALALLAEKCKGVDE